MNQNINPKSLKGKDVFSRTLDLMNKLTPINESVVNSSLEFIKRAPNGLIYTIIRENHKYFIKTTKNPEFKISELGYIGGLQNKMNEAYSSYEEALKHLNMKFQQLNETYNIKGGYNLFEQDEVESEEVDSDQEGVKDKKYKLKISSDDAETSEESPMPTPEPTADLGGEGEMETPEISDVPAEGGEEGMEMPEMGGEEGMEGSDMEGGEEGMEDSDMEGGEEEDEEDLDMDIEEEDDPKKYIQKLTGRLGQKLRELSEVEPKLEKYVINSIISALHIDKMDKKDRIDIMKKFKKKKGMESVMTESYDMDEYYGMMSLDGPFNFEKYKSRVSDENGMSHKSMKHKPMRFKKYELGMDEMMDSDEQWQVPLATAIGSAVGSYLSNKDENMDEELYGGQHKLDLNKNGELDSEDFRMLRSKKKRSADESEKDLRKQKIANALERIRNKRKSADERFGAYDDVKFRSTKDEYDNGGDRGTETADPDIEIDEPLTPPKPKYPDPFNPEVPETYPQPKAEIKNRK